MTQQSVQRVHLTGEKETLLFTLYARAVDARSESPILRDRWAPEVLDRLDGYNHAKVWAMTASEKYYIALRASRLDAWTSAFLARHPDATVLGLGCGLDSRAFRLDLPPGVRWFDVDYPEVIDLRRRLYPERDGYRMIGSSVTDHGWLDEVPTDRPVFVAAEGLVMYLAKDDFRRLLGRITDRFSSGEMGFDVVRSPLVRMSQLFGYRMWSCDDPRELERWNPRLTLVQDAPVMADYRRVPQRPWRLLYGFCNLFPQTRYSIWPLRYRFDSEGE